MWPRVVLASGRKRTGRLSMTIGKLPKAAAGLGLLLMAAACSSDTQVEVPERYVTSQRERLRERYGSVFSGDDGQGFVLFSTRDDRNGTDGTPGTVGVNPFLWRASLEVIDFMPLIQTDPVGGVIITDWYAPPETPDERFKLNVYVLDQNLRADAVSVSVFRQIRTDRGWTDEPVDPQTATAIEDNILTRARELRVASLEAVEG
jgi:hypothetical protein